MVGNHSLEEFAQQEGTTDDPREDTQIGTPDDGHRPKADPNHDYWLDEPDPAAPPLSNDYFAGYYNPTPVPAGRLTVVTDPDKTEPGYPDSPTPERGVFLSGKDGIGASPPSPIAADDDRLREAACAHLEAAQAVLEDPNRIVAVSSGTLAGSLIITVTDQEENQRTVYESPDIDGGCSVATTDPELLEGFYKIRTFATPHKLYSTVSEPRLQLTDLNI